MLLAYESKSQILTETGFPLSSVFFFFSVKIRFETASPPSEASPGAHLGLSEDI